MNIKYNTIRKDAYENGLLKFEDNKLIDILDKNESLYDEKRVFVASVPVLHLDYPDNTFHFSEDYYFSNDTLQIDYIEADFDDGKGYKEYNLDETIDIHYDYPGEKTIKLKVFFDNDSVLYTSFRIKTLNQYVPPYDFQDIITATIPYDGWYDTGNQNDTLGDKGQAEVTIWFAPGHNVLTKPFILLDGFDPFVRNNDGNLDQSRHYKDLYCDLNQVHTLDILQMCYGYDIVVVDWVGGADWIQKNAMCLVEVLKRINRMKVGYNKNIIIGPSMGGMIGRYALAYMEKHNMNHDVSVFIPADSPLRGANIPLGLQFLAYEKEKDEDEKPMLNVLNSPAARQLLVYNYEATLNNKKIDTGSKKLYTPTCHSLRNSFVEELNNLGYPSKPLLMGVTNGSNYGHFQNNQNNEILEPSGKIFRIKKDTTLYGIPGILTINVWALPDQDNKEHTIFRRIFWVIGIDPWVKKYKVKNTLPYDNAPGGVYPHLDRLKNMEGATLYHGYVDFIPTISGLDLDHSINDLYYSHINASQTPFDYIYYPPPVPSPHFTPGYQPTYPYSYNELHSMITAEKRDFFFDIIGYNLPANLFIQNDTLFYPTVDELVEIKSTNSITAGSNVDPNQPEGIVKIPVGNNVHFIAKNEINLEPGFEAEGNFETFIEETEPECDPFCHYPPTILYVEVSDTTIYVFKSTSFIAYINHPSECLFDYVSYNWQITEPNGNTITLPGHSAKISFEPFQTGYHHISVTASNDFGNSEPYEFDINVLTFPHPKTDSPKTKVKNLDNTVRCYPNPNNGIFTVYSNEIQGENIVKVYNTLGTEVYSSVIHTNTAKIDISKLPKGIYIVKIYSEKGVFSDKIIYK